VSNRGAIQHCFGLAPQTKDEMPAIKTEHARSFIELPRLPLRTNYDFGFGFLTGKHRW
jgi:hypothetical protein